MGGVPGGRLPVPGWIAGAALYAFGCQPCPIVNDARQSICSLARTSPKIALVEVTSIGGFENVGCASGTRVNVQELERFKGGEPVRSILVPGDPDPVGTRAFVFVSTASVPNAAQGLFTLRDGRWTNSAVYERGIDEAELRAAIELFKDLPSDGSCPLNEGSDGGL